MAGTMMLAAFAEDFWHRGGADKLAEGNGEVSKSHVA